MTSSNHAPDVASIVREFADVPGGLLPALHAVQHAVGYIDSAHVPVLARTFNLSVAEVHGVVTFYKDFRTTPPAGPVVQVCRAEACQARGADAVHDAARAAGLSLTRADVYAIIEASEGVPLP